MFLTKIHKVTLNTNFSISKISIVKKQKSENFKKLTSGFDLIDGEQQVSGPIYIQKHR